MSAALVGEFRGAGSGLSSLSVCVPQVEVEERQLNNQSVNVEIEPGCRYAQARVQGEGSTKSLSYLFITHRERQAHSRVLGTSVTL